MQLRIEGRTSSTLEISKSGRALTEASTSPDQRTFNKNQSVWFIDGTATTTAAGDIFFYILNNSTQDLNIYSIDILSSAPVTVECISVDSTGLLQNPPAGTNAEVSSLYVESPRFVNATTRFSASFPLIPTGVLGYERCDTANKKCSQIIVSGIIIPQGKVVALMASGAATIRASFRVFREEA